MAKNNDKRNDNADITSEDMGTTPTSFEAPKEDALAPAPAKEAIVQKNTNAANKEITVRVLKNHKCNIGKVDYILHKGETVKVPTSVALILAQAGVVLK